MLGATTFDIGSTRMAQGHLHFGLTATVVCPSRKWVRIPVRKERSMALSPGQLATALAPASIAATGWELNGFPRSLRWPCSATPPRSPVAQLPRHGITTLSRHKWGNAKERPPEGGLSKSQVVSKIRPSHAACYPFDDGTPRSQAPQNRRASSPKSKAPAHRWSASLTAPPCQTRTRSWSSLR